MQLIFGTAIWLCPLAAGCKTSGGMTAPLSPYVSMLTVEPSYSAGSEASVRLVNHSGFTVSYGGCSPKLEVLTGEGWRGVEQANLRPCLDNLQGVAAATEGLLRFQLPEALATGLYRIRIEIMWVVRQYDPNDGVVPREQLITNSFAVRQ